MFKYVGHVLGVFVQKFKRRNHRTKFGFVRFQKESEAKEAINIFNGMRKDGLVLRVA